MAQTKVQDKADQIEDNGGPHRRGDADQGIHPISSCQVIAVAQIVDCAGTAQQQGGDNEREHRKDLFRFPAADLLRLRILVKGPLCLDGIGGNPGR